jgi:tRNA(Ile)-lysidine synthase
LPVAGDSPAQALRAAFAPDPPTHLGVAVSGGGDSVALLILLDDWRRVGGPPLAVVTVDHGLRPEAVYEAAAVAALCARLGLPHDTLHWRWDGTGNLPDAARRGRYALIADWARGQGIGAVALGHTADDQAETVLMRLARGSGVDGLSGMFIRRRADGIDWLRPLLSVSRAALRDLLRGRRVPWAEDPTNDDPAYDRVKARRALAALAPLGVDATTIADTADRMAMAREALSQAAAAFARTHAATPGGDVVIDRAAFARLPEETALRLLSGAIRWITGADYRPRLAAARAALTAALSGSRRTLAGCEIATDATHLRIAREWNAVRDIGTTTVALWDSRWHLAGPHAPHLTIRALGPEGLRDCPDWRPASRTTGLPRQSLLAAPAVWDGPSLVAAPLAGLTNGWSARLAPGRDDFAASLIVH